MGARRRIPDQCEPRPRRLETHQARPKSIKYIYNMADFVLINKR